MIFSAQQQKHSSRTVTAVYTLPY